MYAGRPGAGAAGALGAGAGAGPGAGPGAGGGVSPSFVFLQLYHNMSTYPITPPVPGTCLTTSGPSTTEAARPFRTERVDAPA